ncbi:MAG: hypothetical protein RL095_3432 [Verrucomicrobiota bacterium]|jgi:hypothetical protein
MKSDIPAPSLHPVPDGYLVLLGEIKQRVKQAQVRAMPSTPS